VIEVVLRAVRVDVGSSTPLLLLEELGGERVLPIFIGAPEATAIAYALQHLETPRPMSHDLMGSIITALGARLFTVEITELIDNTFYANLRILHESKEVIVSARPSDAVALALRAGAPILVSDTVMNEQGRVMHLDDDDEMDDITDRAAGESDEAELVAELREFLDTIRPEDFNQ
jgi:bifunctional DNase/RNase